MDKAIEKRLPEIKQLMLRYGVERAYLFGSAVKDTMNEDSDVDLIIRFPESMHYTTYSDNYFALAADLETLLRRHVDLVTEKTIKNPYLREVIDRSKMQLI